jgi:PIN domain nuclease of toxin-antitoxin system
MPKFLLDTHAFLWYILGDSRFPGWLREMIRQRHCTFVVSIVSIWEIGIKVKAGKLVLAVSLEYLVEEAIEKGHLILTLRPEHVFIMMSLPMHHRDPFDRMILAQGVADDYTVVSKDTVFGNYKTNVVWNTPVE